MKKIRLTGKLPAGLGGIESPARRRFASGALLGAAAFFGPWKVNHAWAQARGKKPLLIGLTTDATGQYGASGEDERRGIMMAIREFNEKGGVLGRPIETVHLDTETKPETGAKAAEYMIREAECAFLLGGVHSGVANAISQVAQKYGCIYFNTNSSSPTEAGKDCHRVKFVWDGNGYNFSAAVVKGAITGYGPNWVLMTHDYVWGHSTAKGIRAIVEANGGKIVEEMLVPQNTRDFAAYLRKVKQRKPNVIATAIGGDDIKVLRQQIKQLALDRDFAWINNQLDWPDVYGLGADALFGIFGTNWYWKLDLPGVKEFVKRYRQENPGYRIQVPGNVYYNGYMATRELFRAVERAGSTNNIKVIKELEKVRVSARDRMQHFDAFMNPDTHQMQQTLYMATRNTRATAEKDDIFRILGRLRPDEVQDRDSMVNCKLESYDATPVYEM
jgi:branched-chain amino acid transport system substrate-binding protein